MSNYLEKQRRRVVGNPNLNLHYEQYYKGMEVNLSRGPLVKEWLEKIRLCMLEQVARHSKVLALRIDLRFPRSYWGFEDDVLGNGYLEAFKAHLKGSLDQQPGNRNHGLMILAAREYDEGDRKPHFHLLILLNGNAIRGTGKWEINRNNLYSKLYDAWASALGMESYEIEGRIHFANGGSQFEEKRRQIRNGSMLFDRWDQYAFASLFWACSYLTKVDTKNFYDGCLPFVSPRLRMAHWQPHYVCS